MTLTRRLTVMVVGWIVIILAVFNVIFLARMQTQAYNTLRTTIRLELIDAWHLNQQMPHLAVTNSAWEDALLVIPSTVNFYDSQGRVTSSGWTDEFPEAEFQGAVANWLPIMTADMHQYAIAHNAMGSNDVLHGTMPIPVPGALPNDVPVDPTHLQATAVQGQRRLQFIGVEEPFLYPDGSAGSLVVAATMKPVEQTTMNTLHGLLWTDVPVILIVALGTYLVTAKGLRPINRLIESIRGVTWSELARIHVGKAPSEIKTLAYTINQLLDRVNNGLRDQRRFIADASHELRTPLAIIGGHVNMLRRWGSTNPEVWEPAVHHIVGEVGRLQVLVDNLLLLARIDAGDKPEFHPLTASVLFDMLTELRADGQLLRSDLVWVTSVQVPEDKVGHVSSHALRQVLISLMDNAIKHSPQDTTVTLSAEVDQEELCVSVMDEGEGISPADMPYVFERFYRGKAARSQTHDGSGLGLAIAKELMESYGARITLQSEIGKGTIVTIRMPTQRGGASDGADEWNG